MEEPIISESKKPQLKSLINSKGCINKYLSYVELIAKMESNKNQHFKLYKTLRAHVLPLTHCAFNKSGDK
jgi:hypothetical protein